MRVALVTGANRGIGLATARALVKAGHRVVGTHRSDPPADGDDVVWVPCDVTDGGSVDAAFTRIEEEVGPVEILVSNAGITRDGLLLRMSDEDFSVVVDANLVGSFRVVKRAMRKMVRGRWGRIVLVSSVGAYAGPPGQANYAAAKAGLIGFARSAAREVASRAITVNVVAPGPIATDMTAGLTEDQRAALVGEVPSGRIGTPDEVAAAVTFLTSEEAGFVNGVVLPVDGGMGMGM